MAIDGMFEQALASGDRVGELRRLAQKMLDDGSRPDVVLARFEQARQSLREADCETDEDAVMDVMDFLSGWCSPHVRLPPMSPSEQIGQLWTFTNSPLGASRMKYLSDDSNTPARIVTEIANGQMITAPTCEEPLFEPGKPGGPLEGAFRLNVPILVPAKAYDLFLNHVNGYRGHYAVSERTGDDFNQAILQALTPKLLSHFGKDQNPLSDGDLSLALKHADAKMWEAEKPYKAAGYDWKVQPEINFQRWIDRANEAKPIVEGFAREQRCNSIQELAKTERYSREALECYLEKRGKAKFMYKAIIAVRAPLPDGTQLRLRVMSAWLRRGEIVGSPKANRARQLFAYGWT